MDDPRQSTRAVISYGAVIVVLAMLFLVSLTLDEDHHRILIKENGVIETVSVSLYFAGIALAAGTGKLTFVRERWYFLLLPLVFALRELDFHNRFTTMGIFKTRFFTSDEVGALERLIGIVIIAGLVYTVFLIVKNHHRGFLSGLRSLEPVPLGAVVVAGLIGASKTLDGLPRHLSAIGITLASDLDALSEAIEEILELGIPIVIILMFYFYFRRARRERTDTDAEAVPD